MGNFNIWHYFVREKFSTERAEFEIKFKIEYMFLVHREKSSQIMNDEVFPPFYLLFSFWLNLKHCTFAEEDLRPDKEYESLFGVPSTDQPDKTSTVPTSTSYRSTAL